MSQPVRRVLMNRQVERVRCPTCERIVPLSYGMASLASFLDTWACPHCHAKHTSTKPGMHVVTHEALYATK